MRRLAHRVLYWYCAECDGLIWPWQARCGSRHRTCLHAFIVERYHFLVDAGIGPDAPWPCAFCGEVPR